MSQALLALLELAHPGRPQADLLAMIEATPNARATEKPAQRRVGSRPRSSASMERRRSWAASGLLPPCLACRFTLAEQAVLAVVAEQVATRAEPPGAGRFQTCELPLDAIAAKAGVCRTTVRNALREARTLGLIHVEERRLSAWRNLPHRIMVVSPEWLSWLKMRAKGLTRQTRAGVHHGEHSGGGRKSVSPTSTDRKKEGFARAEKAESKRQDRHDPGRPLWKMMSTNGGS
jgi:hypothetical protein